MLLEPSASLWPPYCRVVHRLLSKKLWVWSSCFLSLFLTHRHHLSRVKAERKKVPYWGWACILLMRLWQDGRLFHFPVLGFETTLLKGRSLIFSLALGTFSFVHPYTHSHCSLDSWPPKNCNRQPHPLPLLLWRDPILPLEFHILPHCWL